jgi:hypothetical protein
LLGWAIIDVFSCYPFLFRFSSLQREWIVRQKSIGRYFIMTTSRNNPAGKYVALNGINKLVVISTAFKRSGWYPEIQSGMASVVPEFFIGTPMHDAYSGEQKDRAR